MSGMPEKGVIRSGCGGRKISMRPVLANQYTALTAPLALSQPPGEAGVSGMFAPGRQDHEQSGACRLDVETVKQEVVASEKTVPDTFFNKRNRPLARRGSVAVGCAMRSWEKLAFLCGTRGTGRDGRERIVSAGYRFRGQLNAAALS